MFNIKNFSIGTKMALLIGTLLIALVMIAGAGFFQAESLTAQTNRSNDLGKAGYELINASRKAQVDFQRQVQEWKNTLLRGNNPEDFTKYRAAFDQQVELVRAELAQTKKKMVVLQLPTAELDGLLDEHATMLAKYNEALKQYDSADAGAAFAVDRLVRGVDRATSAGMDKLVADIEGKIGTSLDTIAADSTASAAKSRTQQMILVLVFGILGALAGVLISRNIRGNVSNLADVVGRVAEGDYAARSTVKSGDELGKLGGALNDLLNDRVARLANSEKETEQLNNSIISLLQAVAQLSKRDLTVLVPVTDDVTGAVADALNLLTRETASVLSGVTRISGQVANASEGVRSSSSMAISAARDSQSEVEQTSIELESAADKMREISELATACNLVAAKATKTTQTALETVADTVTGINGTRDTIRETEKRIKRLGERSQEIGGVVSLINNIAERTSILALNASMHAASAGEAGKTFAVVASEVQRLAESARDATSQIGSLVTSIQSETADAVATMNATIARVVDGSRLAERAGEEMRTTQTTTAELVAAVRQIAERLDEQSKATRQLTVRSQQIRERTQQTSKQLVEQGEQTSLLVEYARGLAESVGVFRLPAAAS